MQRRSFVCLSLLLAAAGCEQRVDSNKPTLTQASPQIICDAQLTTPIALTGSNLTPLPIRTLGGTNGGSQPPTLQLPKVSLLQSESLDGMAASGMPVDIPDDFDTRTGHVRWESESAMSFDVFPELMLKDGVYDVLVTNPDGQVATLAHAIAAVPAPVLKMVIPPGICDAQSDQTIKLEGTGFLVVNGMKPSVTFTPSAGGMPQTYTPTMLGGCVDIAKDVEMGVQACTEITIVVKKGDLPPGTYTVTITNPAPAGCKSTEPITIQVNPPPKVTGVKPMTICQGGGALDVTGTDFQKTPKVSLGSADAGSVTFMSSMEVQASWGGKDQFNPGMKYDLTLTNPDGCSDTLKDAVTAVAGPVLFFVDPPVVFNGITTQVTMYATSVSPPLMSVKLVPDDPMNQCTGAVPVTLTAMIDPNHPKRILAEIPMGTVACTYDVQVQDNSGCPATLVNGVKVVDKATVQLTAIAPPFGWQGGETAVTITAQGGLMPTPRAYLNPHTAGNNTIATALGSVAYVDATKLTAIVPKGLDPAANPYDLIVVNPDGTVGVLQSAYNSEANPPPVIDGISPGSLPVPAGGTLTISGANFRQPKVTLTCQNAQPFDGTITSSSASSITVNLANAPFNTLVAPNFCIIRVTDGDDMSFFDFSALAVSGSSGNLATAHPTTDMPEARRGLSLVGAQATRAANFLYVIGGDNGMAAGATDTVLSASSDEKGAGTWFTQRYKLNAKRTLAGAASLGRYLYVAGGNDGAGPVNTVERALVLDPLQAPSITDVDIVPGMGTGLGGGTWYYRVAALMDANDPDNPGGETLPSDEQVLSIPDLTQKLQITITWSSVPGAVGYRIYRTPNAGMISGQEQQIADVMGGNVVTYTDKGDAPVMNALTPLPQGSTGAWRVLPAMGAKREGVRVAFGADPSDGTRHYLYALFGKDQAALASYEFLAVTVGGNGQQTFANAWTPGAKTSPTGGKYFHSAFSADHAIASFVNPGVNFIYFGGGTANGSSAVNSLEVGTVAAGGDLGTIAAAGTATIKSFGQGFAIAANYLYGFGNEMPSATVFAGQIAQGQAPTVSNYNNNGNAMMQARFLPGTVLQGALIYNAGGCDMPGGACATKTVEYFIW